MSLVAYFTISLREAHSAPNPPALAKKLAICSILMTEYYAEDLAHIHDNGFGFTAKSAAAELLKRLKAAKIRSGQVVSLGCGSGILLADVVANGYQGVGFDISEPLLEIARRRVPSARLENRSYRNLRVPSCDAVVAIGEVLNYQFDPKIKRRKTLRRLFESVHDALPAGGLFLFDIATPERSLSRNNKTVWWEEDDWGLVLNVSTDRKVLTRHMITFRKLVSMYRRSEETHRLRLHKPQLIRRLLKDAGFSVTILQRFDTLQLPEGLVGFLAKKR